MRVMGSSAGSGARTTTVSVGALDDFEVGRWVDRDAFAQRVGEWFSLHFRTRDARLHRALG